MEVGNLGRHYQLRPTATLACPKMAPARVSGGMQCGGTISWREYTALMPGNRWFGEGMGVTQCVASCGIDWRLNWPGHLKLMLLKLCITYWLMVFDLKRNSETINMI